jgi:serine/threonine protein kinase
MNLPTLGRYQLVRLIGEGGMGSVYEARDPYLGRRVAIKTISLAAAEDAELVRERLKREAGLAGILGHPNIVDIYDFGEAEDTAFIVMQYLPGRTLESHLRETNPYAWPEFVPLLVPCAAALDYAHARGVVHLDMKPSNIMVLDDGVPKVLDFGLARLAYHSSVSVTGAGLDVRGTISYLAPEAINGAPSGPASDQFSLAIIIYRLLTATFPFVGDSAATMLYSILHQSPKPVRELEHKIPAETSRAIERALNKDPACRFSSCSELLDSVCRPLVAAGLLDNSPYRIVPGSAGVGSALTQVFPADRAPVPPSAVPPPAPSTRTGRSLRSLRTGIHYALWRLGRFLAIFTARKHPAVKNAPTGPEVREQAVRELIVAAGTPIEMPDGLRPASKLRGQGESMPPGLQTRILRLPLDKRIAPNELASLQTDELISLARNDDFEHALALEGKWLPGPEGGEAPLLAFREAARYLIAAKTASSAHNVVDHLTRAETVLMTAGNQLYRDRSSLAEQLPRALEVWKQVTRERLRTARARLNLELPNPFRAGQPLRPDQGRPVFRGRQDLIRQIETILADASQSGSIALLGPRRCGKTSLLQMLPSMLPDCVCIFFDLQDNPVDSTQSFFGALHQQAARQAFRDRRLELSNLPGGEVFTSATGWFQALDNMEGDFRILLCIDEFERLEDLFPGNRQGLLRLMGLLRATIQHRRKLRLLVSGVAPFDELGALWNDHFINARQLRVGHLDRSTALDLLMRPLPDFPAQAIPENVAARIYERTGGQPYLLQLYGSVLIALLNGAMRKAATLADIDVVEEEAMSQGTHYFRHTYESAPESARTILEQLAKGQTPAMTPSIHRWLVRRELLTDERDLRIPVLGTFIRQEFGLN